MTLARGEHGFTLVELLVTMVITTIVFGATLTVLDVFQTNNRYAQLRNETQDNARTAADRLARQLRNVAAPTTGSAGALETAEPYSIVFQTIDASAAEAGENATDAMRVRYCLNDATNPENEVLWTQSQKWKTKTAPEIPSTSACPGTGWETSTQLVQHVTNRIGGQGSTCNTTPTRCLFRYSAETVAQTTSVEMNLFLDLNPGHRPGETQLTTGIALRNANRPPGAKFTITKVNGHARLNASESTNPDGLALTYKWWKDGAELSTTSQVYETPASESAGNHTYKLEIADPSGLSSQLEKTEKFP
jgi:prepilin-type N-terminal cleavage/methylation domain-containing protein